MTSTEIPPPLPRSSSPPPGVAFSLLQFSTSVSAFFPRYPGVCSPRPQLCSVRPEDSTLFAKLSLSRLSFPPHELSSAPLGVPALLLPLLSPPLPELSSLLLRSSFLLRAFSCTLPCVPFTPTPDTINLNSSKYEIILHLLVNDDTLFVSGDNMDGHLTGARPLPLKDESGSDFNMSNPPGMLTNETDVDVNMQNSSVSTFKPPMFTQPPVDQHYGLIKLEDIVESEADEHQQTFSDLDDADADVFDMGNFTGFCNGRNSKSSPAAHDARTVLVDLEVLVNNPDYSSEYQGVK
jgi:hypothetical protein